MSIMEDREDFSSRSSVGGAMEHFTYHWAPAQPRKAAEFHADLLGLIQAVHRDSARPMEAALKNAFSLMPVSSILTPSPAVPVEIVEALRAALPDLHRIDSNMQSEVEASGGRYEGLRSVRLVGAALEKLGVTS